MPVRISSGTSSKGKRGNLQGVFLLVFAALLWVMLISRENSGHIAEAVPAPVVTGFDAVRLPVPEEPVPAGTKLSTVRFRTVSFPRQQVPSGALSDVQPYMGGVALASLPAHVPVFAENLSMGNSAINPVVERIPDGMRAMTIRVDATTAVEGWAGSGSVVDVLLVEKDRTTVIAEQVKILSAERSVSPVEGSAAPKLPTTVTLLVTQEQCLAINTGIPRGRIAFALRSARDNERWTETIFTPERLNGGISGDSAVAVSGFISVRDETGDTAYALTGNTWVRADTVPQGFFAARDGRPGGQSAKEQ